MKNLDIKKTRDQITALLLAHPELQEDDVLRADMIEGETGAFEFISAVLRKVGDTCAIWEGLIEYIGQLEARKDRLERRQLALRSLIFKVMQTAELKKAELPEATVSMRNGTQKVVIVDEKQIPDSHMRVRTEPDKIKIKQTLQSGGTIPGAALSNAEPTIAIHIK